jgi:L-arabinose isomerase
MVIATFKIRYGPRSVQRADHATYVVHRVTLGSSIPVKIFKKRLLTVTDAIVTSVMSNEIENKKS